MKGIFDPNIVIKITRLHLQGYAKLTLRNYVSYLLLGGEDGRKKTGRV